jgi:hypothetical protein
MHFGFIPEHFHGTHNRTVAELESVSFKVIRTGDWHAPPIDIVINVIKTIRALRVCLPTDVLETFPGSHVAKGRASPVCAMVPYAAFPRRVVFKP